MTYISDDDRLVQPMGQYQLWEGKLFYYRGANLGWRYIKGLS